MKPLLSRMCYSFEIHSLWRALAGSEELWRNRLLAARERFDFGFGSAVHAVRS